MIPQSYYDYATKRESGGNLYAKNPRSSALGPNQFIESTWMGLMQRRPDLGLTADGRTDPEQNKRAMRAFTEENAGVLSSKGHDTSTTNLYLAHRFGPQGALALLSTDPSVPIDTAVSPAVMRANPDLVGKTVGQLTGATGMPMQSELVPQQRRAPGLQYTPGATAVAGDGALSPSMVYGPGALSEDQGMNIGDGLQGAGAWLMAINDPKALSALSTLGPKPGRYSTQYDAKTGRILTIDTQTGRAVANQDPNFDPNREAKQAYDNKTAEQFAAMNDDIYKKSQEAQGTQAQLAQMRQLIQNPAVYQGAGGEWVSTAKNIANSIGLKTEGLSDTQLLQSLANQMTLQGKQMAGGMPGALSDNDLKFLQKMTVNLSNDPAANMQIVDRVEKIYQRMQDANRLREEYIQKNGRLDEGFRKQLRAYADANPLFDAQAAPAAAPGAAPAATGGIPVKVIKVHPK